MQESGEIRDHPGRASGISSEVLVFLQPENGKLITADAAPTIYRGPEQAQQAVLSGSTWSAPSLGIVSLKIHQYYPKRKKP